MLPKSLHFEAKLFEAGRRVEVTQPVSADLGAPEVDVGLGLDKMIGTAVPVAPVDEDVEPNSAKVNICSAPPVEWERARDAVPQS